jgi:hypothetical protein
MRELQFLRTRFALTASFAMPCFAEQVSNDYTLLSLR